MSEVPTLREEIDRKAFEQLERLAGQLETGRINDAQFDVGVHTVWNCVSGLASEWVIQTLGEIRDSRKGEAHKDRRFMVGFEEGMWEVLILSRDLGGGKLTLRGIPAGRSRDWDFTECPNPSAECVKKQNQVTEALVAKGFRRV